MHLVETRVMIVVKKTNNAASDCDSHTEYIDEQVQLVFHHTTKRYQ
jgi:hypothetical protein